MSHIVEFPPPPRAASKALSNGHHKEPSLTDSTVAGNMSRSGSEAMSIDVIAESSTRAYRASVYSTRSTEYGIDEVEREDDEDFDFRPIVHVEVRQKSDSWVHGGNIGSNVSSWIQSNCDCVQPESTLEGWGDVDMLRRSVLSVRVAECSTGSTERLDVGDVDLRVHVYKHSRTSAVEGVGILDEDADDEVGQVSAATVKVLPSEDLEGLWESLIYANDLKERLLRYIYSTIAFSEANIDQHIVSWNRMVLLHGPPGTGKTSLCRALAQKLSIRLSDSYRQGKIVEINSHSLFSKWFSESGKLVQKLFMAVEDMIAEPDTFVVVMIDEAESLTAARAGAMSGNEPSDAIRVVNALLTGLDRLKPHKNVLVMTTSNIAGAIDPAFVDRADIVEFVDNPPPEAIYAILAGCLKEMQNGGLAKRQEVLDWRATVNVHNTELTGNSRSEPSLRLRKLAKKCHANGVAGRLLRRLPVLAHARYLASYLPPGEVRPLSLDKWLTAMDRVIDDEQGSKDTVAKAEGRRGTTRVQVEAGADKSEGEGSDKKVNGDVRRTEGASR